MRLLAGLVSICLLAGACGDDSTGEVGGADDSTTTTTSSPPAEPTSSTTPAPLTPIALCEDIDPPAPDVIGTLPGGQNLDDELMGVVSTYIAEHEDTYAGRWIDRDHGGTLVIAFTDDPGPHLEELLSRRPSESDAIDVVQVEHTEAELQATQVSVGDVLEAEGFEWQGIGSGTLINRVSISLIRPTSDDLDQLAALLPADMVCVEGPLWDESMAPPTVDEPFTVMADAGDDPLVTCGSDPFLLSALDGPPDVDPATNDPAEVVLLAGGMEGLGVPQTGWRTLSRNDDEALFANFGATLIDPNVSTSVPNTPPTVSTLVHRLRKTPAGWTLAGTSAGECRLRLAVPDGVEIAGVGLDPANPVDPTSTTLHLLVRERSCSGSADPTERLRPPEVIETTDDIRIAIGVVPPEGFQTCPGNPSVPITIELDEPVGDRALLDGLRVPPEPLEDLSEF